MRPDDHRTDRAMPGSGTEFSRDEWIVAIADHGVDPTDMPGRVVGTDGRDSLARRKAPIARPRLSTTMIRSRSETC